MSASARRRMKRPKLRRASAVLAVSFALSLSAWASPRPHGGNFPPPPPDDPPNGGWGGPGDTVPNSTVPAPNPNGPGGTGDTSGSGPSGPTASTAGSPGSPGSSSPIAATARPQGALTPGGSVTPVDFSAWTWWWEFNKEPFLDLRSHLFAGAPVTGEEGYFLGRGQSADAAASRMRPSREEIRTRIVPALMEALESRSSNDLTTAALIALARIGEDHSGADRVQIQGVLRPFLKSSSQEVSETATAALGILGNESAALLLSEILLDTDEGRRSVDQSRVPGRTRAFSAYALGLLGAQTEMEDVRRYVVHKLLRALERDDTSTSDLGVACVLSVGRVPLAWSGEIPETSRPSAPLAAVAREAQILQLLSVLGDKKRQRLVRAHTPTSLALLLGGPESPAPTAGPLRERVGRELLARFDPRKRESVELRQSCAIALGLIGDNDADELDRAIRNALRGADGDRHLEHMALIALARTVARDGSGPASGVQRIQDELAAKLSRSSSDDARWSALALAILERTRTRRGHLPSLEIERALRDQLLEVRSPIDVGAVSIACGILGSLESEAALLKKLRTTEEESARGFSALGLGLVQARSATDEIRIVVDESTYRPRLLREASIALGLLSDPAAAGLLVEKLTRTRSLAAQASIAQALGEDRGQLQHHPRS